MTKLRPSVFQRVLHLPDAIKFQESVFALPFAYSGMVLAAEGLPTWQQFLWITIAMVSARTLGMSANRIIDHHIDIENPRTSQRHLPRGLVLPIDMWALTIISGLVFFIAAAQLNLLALLLAPIAAAYLIFYPFTKRFTWAANFLLGCFSNVCVHSKRWVLKKYCFSSKNAILKDMPLQKNMRKCISEDGTAPCFLPNFRVF